MAKCLICGQRKGKRTCIVRNGEQICSLCCASNRNHNCGDCTYYETSKKYEREKVKQLSQENRIKHYCIEINEKAEEAVEKAMILVEKNKLEEAERLIKSLEEQYPGNHMVLFAVGALHSFRGELEPALQYYNLALDIFPYYEEAAYNKAITFMKMGRIGDCVYTLRELLSYTDEGGEISEMALHELDAIKTGIERHEGVDIDTYLVADRLFNQGYGLLEKGKYSHAIPFFEDSLRKKPQSQQCHGNIGLCYMFMGQKASAIRALEKALEICPEYEVAAVNLALAQKMKEGVPLEGRKRSVNYNLEYADKPEGAYIQDYCDLIQEE